MYISNEHYRKDLNTALLGIVNYHEFFHKSFLITGATGLIGSFLVDMLMYANQEKNAEIEVYALARKKEVLEKRFSSVTSDARLHFVIQDVVEPIKLSNRVDYIIHAAGDGFPAAFREYPVEVMTPAILGTYRLLNYAKEMSIERFLYISSGEIYGKLAGEEHAFKENEVGNIDSMNVRSCYPMAKRCAETMCVSFFEQYKVSTVVARLSHIYGANVGTKDNRATVQFMRNSLDGQDIVLHSPGKQMRSYTYVTDCVSGILTILLNGKNGEAYNVANSLSRVTIADFARIMARLTGNECKFRYPNGCEKKELTPIEYAVLDSNKLESLGWKGQYDIESGIERMMEIAARVHKD